MNFFQSNNESDIKQPLQIPLPLSLSLVSEDLVLSSNNNYDDSIDVNFSNEFMDSKTNDQSKQLNRKHKIKSLINLMHWPPGLHGLILGYDIIVWNKEL